MEMMSEEDRRNKVGEIRMHMKEIDRQLKMLTESKKKLMDELVFYESMDVKRTLN